MYKRAVPLLALLACSCFFKVSASDVTLAPGEATLIEIYAANSFTGEPTGPGPGVASSDPSIVEVIQFPATPGQPNVRLLAHQPGVAYVVNTSNNGRLVTVHVLACLPVAVNPVTPAVMNVKVGTPVKLEVEPVRTMPLLLSWYEENEYGWSQIPGEVDTKYTFTPRKSGTYRFEVRYTDRCGSASTILTVIASTRTHAVRGPS